MDEKNHVYEQVEHSHQLLHIWGKYKASRHLKLFLVVDNVDTPKAEFGARDVCELAVVDHAEIYLLILQVDPYTAVLGDGQKIAMKNGPMKIMVTANRVTTNQSLRP
jgi:hypothetical protein